MSLAEKLELSIKAQEFSVFQQPRLGCVGIQVAFISSGSGRHHLWCSPTAGGAVPPPQGGALRRLGAPRETFIFPELYHFFHNTTLPSRWKVPAGRLRILSMCFCSPPCPSAGSRLLGKDTSLFIPACSRLALPTDSAMEMSP